MRGIYGLGWLLEFSDISLKNIRVHFSSKGVEFLIMDP